MKRIFALLLALVILASLCACGKSESEIRGAVTTVGEAPETEAPAQPDAGETEEAAEESPIEDVEVKIGLINGGRYESEFLGIGCELDENWTYAAQEDLAELMGNTEEIFADTDYAESIKEAEMFYDMVASTSDGVSSINVLLQNMGLIYGTVITEEQYIELATKDLTAQMEAAGISNVEWEIVELDFAGQTRPGLKISSQVNGIAYYCTQVYVKSGSYMAVITLASYLEDTTEPMLDYFFAV